MSDSSLIAPAAAMRGARLLHPSTLILLGANLLPLAGVLFWSWDAFVLLMLYWLETAVIGFWTIVRVATAPRGSLGGLTSADGRTNDSPVALAAFFVVHAGLFMSVHFLFLWALFAGDWAKTIHGPVDFVTKLMIQTGLWLPLLVLFLARGVVFFYERLGARILVWLYPERRRSVAPPPAPSANQGGAIIGAFYARIIVMHVAIIFGGFLAFFGSLAPLIVLVTLKTIIDVGLHLAWDFKDDRKTTDGAVAARG